MCLGALRVVHMLKALDCSRSSLLLIRRNGGGTKSFDDDCEVMVVDDCCCCCCCCVVVLVKRVIAGFKLVSDGGKAATVGLPPPDVDDGVRKVDPKGSDNDDVLIAPVAPATGNVATNGCGGLLLSKTSNGDDFGFTAGGGWLGEYGSRREAADRDCAIGFSVVGVNTSNGDDFDCAVTTDDDTDDLSETDVTLVLNKSSGLGFAFAASTGIGADTGTAGIDCVAKESNGDAGIPPGIERPRGIGTRSGGCNKGAMPLVGLLVGAKPPPVPWPPPVVMVDAVA